jgi:hypothetical protein
MSLSDRTWPHRSVDRFGAHPPPPSSGRGARAAAPAEVGGDGGVRAAEGDEVARDRGVQVPPHRVVELRGEGGGVSPSGWDFRPPQIAWGLKGKARDDLGGGR